ncbi:unnamed protein product [Nezara viridula]|uniref:Uncharacterized protein n=1 Tax=Nezara viridula TaxID=85310 RepID=A0A9P0MR46_NEZVI|nr:unnamed protein product [Nezara viridula]
MAPYVKKKSRKSIYDVQCIEHK